jgi:uncharacterized membrane protein
LHYLNVKLNSTERLKFYIKEETNFTLSNYGVLLNNLNYALKDVVVFLIVLVLNIIIIIKLKKLIKVKEYKLKTVQTRNGNEKHLSLQPMDTNLKRLKNNKTIMVIFLCLITLIEHIVLIYIDFELYRYDNGQFYYMKSLYGSIESLAISIKQFTNFFIFILLSKSFKNIFTNLFRNSNNVEFPIKLVTLFHKN